MKREILDSNIYGKIIEVKDMDFVLNNLPKSGIIIYGVDVIRKELRDTPKEKIVVAEDNKTMLSTESIKSYELVNSIKKLATPKFKSYEEFKNEISKK